MKKISQVIFLMFIYFGINGQHVFNKTFQSSNTFSSNFAKSTAIMSTEDSSVLAVGMNYNQLQMSAIKIDNLGDTIWSFVADYGIGGGDFLLSALECHDGNYIVGGISETILPFNLLQF